MPEIEIEEYVRNESGYIHRVDSFDKLTNFFKDEDGKLKEWVGEDVWGNTIAEIIVKHSKNIIDLIEVGDYVNELQINYIGKEKVGYLSIYGDEDIFYENNEIRDIVTKEQFDSVKYIIEEEK